MRDRASNRRSAAQRRFERDITRCVEQLCRTELLLSSRYPPSVLAVAMSVQAVRLLLHCIEKGEVSKNTAQQFVRKLMSFKLPR